MVKSININLITLAILVILAIYIGSLLGSKEQPVDTSYFQHKYDSLELITKQMKEILNQSALSRDSAQKEINKLKSQNDSISRVRSRREEIHQAEAAKYRKLYLAMTEDELSKEAERVYNEAHPIPLFEGDGEPVGVGKGPLVHLLERNNEATYLEAENHDLKEQLTIVHKENALLDFQITKYKGDSVTHVHLMNTKDTAISVKNQELDAQKKAHKKEIRREKIKTVVATTIAVLATAAAIVF